MAFREDELIAKLKSGEKVSDVSNWYMREIAEKEPRDHDLSPFELAFTGMIAHYYEKWKRERKLN